MNQLYSDSYALIENALKYDELGDYDNAKATYLRALESIDRITEADDNEMKTKMLTVRHRVEERLESIRSCTSVNIEDNKKAVTAQLESIRDAFESVTVADEVDEIFSIPAGVQLFIIEVSFLFWMT